VVANIALTENLIRCFDAAFAPDAPPAAVEAALAAMSNLARSPALVEIIVRAISGDEQPAWWPQRDARWELKLETLLVTESGLVREQLRNGLTVFVGGDPVTMQRFRINDGTPPTLYAGESVVLREGDAVVNAPRGTVERLITAGESAVLLLAGPILQPFVRIFDMRDGSFVGATSADNDLNRIDYALQLIEQFGVVLDEAQARTILDLTFHAAYFVRWRAIRALYATGAHALLRDRLEDVLGDPYPPLRTAARRLLDALAADRMIPQLQEA
jgi:hypothetical protein